MEFYVFTPWQALCLTSCPKYSRWSRGGWLFIQTLTVLGLQLKLWKRLSLPSWSSQYNDRGGSAWPLNVTSLEVPVTSCPESGHWEVAAHHVSGPLCISTGSYSSLPNQKKRIGDSTCRLEKLTSCMSSILSPFHWLDVNACGTSQIGRSLSAWIPEWLNGAETLLSLSALPLNHHRLHLASMETQFLFY